MNQRHVELLTTAWEAIDAMIMDEVEPEIHDNEEGFSIIMFHDVIGKMLRKDGVPDENTLRLFAFVHARKKYMEAMNQWSKRQGT